MPTLPPKPCRHHGCGQLVRDGSGFCAVHLKPRSGTFADRERGSSAERGYGYAWQQTRKRILHRDCGLCQPCLSQGKPRPAKAVDHIVPKSRGGTDDDANLQAICTACHTAKTNTEKR